MLAEAPLTHGRIAKFYVPLALSWLFMAIESPVCIGVISRLPHPEINTAAFNIVMGLAIFIESPVIDLLATSTTLAKSHRDYVALSRFVWILMLGVTAVHGLVVFTPLYWVVTRSIMGVPESVAEAARVGLAIMLPWSAFIGWRRYLQGILIRFHRTRLVGLGTAVRVGTVLLVSLALYFTSSLSGVAITAIALVCSVGAEALFAHWASRGVIAENLAPESPRPALAPGDDAPVVEGEFTQAPGTQGRSATDPYAAPLPGAGPTTLKKLTNFHAPLTLTTMVTLIGGPTVSAFLAKTPDPVLTLAAWQVAFSLVWLLRTITFALPEVVITLYKDRQTARKLRDFCLFVGLGTSGLGLLVALTHADVAFFRNVYGRTEEIAWLAHIAVFAAAPLALIGALQSYVRGMLTAHHLNVARFAAILVSMATLVLALWVGLFTPWRGVLSAAVALNVALLAELAVLVWFWRRNAAHKGGEGARG